MAITHKRVSQNALAFADLCWHLQEGEYSRNELCAKVGISDSTLRTWLRYLRRPDKKLVYICERRMKGTVGAGKLIYTWGLEKDAQPLKRQGDAVYSARYRERKLIKKALYGIDTSR